jgi:SAM-dependent methyltransferase
MKFKTIKTWKHFGKENPYYGVLSDEKFKVENITELALKEFFRTGDTYVQETLHRIKMIYGSDLSEASILDFGCGVGRLTIPFAAVTNQKTVGIDVSKDILDKAAIHAQEMGAQNIEFLTSQGKILPSTAQFDFINSYIVFQHIESKIGMKLIAQLLEKLKIGGIIQLQITYGNNWPSLKYWHYYMRSHYHLYNFLYCLIKNKSLRAEPMMQMNGYDPKELFKLFSTYSYSIHIEFTNHAGFLGASYLLKREF